MYNVLVIYDVLNFASTIMNKFSFFVLSWKNLISDVFFFGRTVAKRGYQLFAEVFYIVCGWKVSPSFPRRFLWHCASQVPLPFH